MSENTLFIDPLSQRELEVLKLVAGGASNQEIALAFVVAPGTVKLHVSHILSKLGGNSRARPGSPYTGGIARPVEE